MSTEGQDMSTEERKILSFCKKSAIKVLRILSVFIIVSHLEYQHRKEKMTIKVNAQPNRNRPVVLFEQQSVSHL